MHFLLKLVLEKIPKVYPTRSQVKKGPLRDLIFLIFAISIEKFNVKVSFRLDYSYIRFDGGGRVTA